MPRRLVERFLLDNYKPHQLSTYALTLYRYNFKTQDDKGVPCGEIQQVVSTAWGAAHHPNLGAGFSGDVQREAEQRMRSRTNSLYLDLCLDLQGPGKCLS